MTFPYSSPAQLLHTDVSLLFAPVLHTSGDVSLLFAVLHADLGDVSVLAGALVLRAGRVAGIPRLHGGVHITTKTIVLLSLGIRWRTLLPGLGNAVRASTANLLADPNLLPPAPVRSKIKSGVPRFTLVQPISLRAVLAITALGGCHYPCVQSLQLPPWEDVMLNQEKRMSEYRSEGVEHHFLSVISAIRSEALH